MLILCAFWACFPGAVRAQDYMQGDLANEPLVDVSKVAPAIVIDLRYATDRNITGHPIYPAGMKCLLRKGVAGRLKSAETILELAGYRLKIWDAYRPSHAQKILWALVQNPEVVADPNKGGSRHSWGVAVDVTLVDLDGKDVPMPTDFDDFTDAAKSDYKGKDPVVAKNLNILKNAMDVAGFEGMRDEWWHFSSTTWRSYGLVDDPGKLMEKEAAPTATTRTASASPSPASTPGASPAPQDPRAPQH
ncbi:MAG TPA: M15 family metallopeptidase [Chthoniobacteraceae bacterium]|nr:M15 family metallopeptidase [Chthoniobacteraceae bacterium]